MLVGQVGENREINAVFSKALGILGHAELFEPVRNLRPPTTSAPVQAEWRWTLLNPAGRA
jgi:hypothetical protein